MWRLTWAASWCTSLPRRSKPSFQRCETVAPTFVEKPGQTPGGSLPSFCISPPCRSWGIVLPWSPPHSFSLGLLRWPSLVTSRLCVLHLPPSPPPFSRPRCCWPQRIMPLQLVGRWLQCGPWILRFYFWPFWRARDVWRSGWYVQTLECVGIHNYNYCNYK